MTVIREQGCLRVLLSETETAHYNIDRLLFCRYGFTAEAVLLKLYKKRLSKRAFYGCTKAFHRNISDPKRRLRGLVQP